MAAYQTSRVSWTAGANLCEKLNISDKKGALWTAAELNAIITISFWISYLISTNFVYDIVLVYDIVADIGPGPACKKRKEWA